MNKYQEAKKWIDEVNTHPEWARHDFEEPALSQLTELVEKATPKKAILVHDYDGYVYECPNCHEEFRPNYILDNITWKGCPFCLQALDWSEEDDC